MQNPPLRLGINAGFTPEGHLSLENPARHGCAVFDVGGAQCFELSVTALRDDEWSEEDYAGSYCVGIIGIADIDAVRPAPGLGDEVEDARGMVSDVRWIYCVSTGSFKISSCHTDWPLFDTHPGRRIFPGSLARGRTLSMQYGDGRLGYRLDASEEYTDVTSHASPSNLAAPPPDGKGKGKLSARAAKGKAKGADMVRAETSGGFAPCVWMFCSRSRAWRADTSLKVKVRPGRGEASAHIVAKRMKTLWEDRAFADCVVECAGEKFDAHRAVLCAASPIFAAAFGGSMQEAREARFEVRGCELPCAVQAMLEFIYTGRLPDLSAKALAELLPLAAQYQLKELCPIVAVRLADKVTVETVRDTVRVVRQFSEHDGVSEVYSFLIARLKASEELLKESLV